MMRLAPLALAVLLLAGVAVVDGLDHVGMRVFAYNGTHEAAVVHVVVARAGHVLLDKGARVAPNETAALGGFGGPPGDYSWSVVFGRDSAHGGGGFVRSTGPMDITLLPDGSVEVGFGVA
jgi:hypothetical protein